MGFQHSSPNLMIMQHSRMISMGFNAYRPTHPVPRSKMTIVCMGDPGFEEDWGQLLGGTSRVCAKIMLFCGQISIWRWVQLCCG